MRIAVMGTGYVGLVVGTCLAEFGNTVTCVERDQDKLDILRSGRPAHYEAGLDRLMQRNIDTARLSFAQTFAEGDPAAEVVFLAVGTPPGADGSADLSQVIEAARQVALAAVGSPVIVIKSTVPVGTGDKIQAVMQEAGGRDFDVVSNPEFLKEGHAVEDFLSPDRVVVGTDSETARELLRRIYAPVTSAKRPLLFMDRRSSELTKYAANALLATKISFMNELSRLCDQVEANIDDVRRGVGTDPRIGHRFLYAGPGFGGSCFPKDVSALAATGREHGVTLSIAEAVLLVNDEQRRLIPRRILAELGSDGRLDGVCVAVLGLAFKPETDDLRESPALVLVDMLLEAGATLRCYDPKAMDAGRQFYAQHEAAERLVFCDDAYDAADGADVLTLMTEWRPFRQLQFERVHTLMRGNVVYDARNIWSSSQLRELGFLYRGIGRR